MEKLASRSDLTIKLQFEYQHKQYELTIPAGAKIDTECDWYGPLKLCSLYEYTVKWEKESLGKKIKGIKF